MKMTFRWYGAEDPIKLDDIRQIPGINGIVSAIYDVPAGEVWSYERIMALKKEVEAKGLKLDVIESVPVHEEIKMGLPSRDQWIANYKKTLGNLGKAGIKVVCYNFMPVFDWTRTELNAPLPDGSRSLLYDHKKAKDIDPLSGDLVLPGWDLSYEKDRLETMMMDYRNLSEEQLMENLIYFLQEVIPAAEEAGIFMAIHPDDPPWSIFGLPRVVKNMENVSYILEKVDSRHNGITFCIGSYGADPANDLFEIIDTARGRIHFVHARNIKWIGEKSFQETSHLAQDGSLDMPGILKKLKDSGFDGPVRPDHGRMIWGEEGRPGYGLYDRSLGAAYIHGILDALYR